MNSFFKIFVFFNIVIFYLIISGCGTVRESAGVTRKAPDEYSITKSPPLVLPPDYNLLPSEEIIQRKALNKEDKLTKEILFGLTESDKQLNLESSNLNVLNSILEKSGANDASNSIREEIDVDYANLTSCRGFTCDLVSNIYLTEEEILDAVAESSRIRNNIFNNNDILTGDIPITTRPKTRKDSFIKRLF